MCTNLGSDTCCTGAGAVPLTVLAAKLSVVCIAAAAQRQIVARVAGAWNLPDCYARIL